MDLFIHLYIYTHTHTHTIFEQLDCKNLHNLGRSDRFKTLDSPSHWGKFGEQDLESIGQA